MPDLTGQTIRGRYRIQRLIGKGGMGMVYLAHDTHDANAPCAVKMLRAELTHDPRVRRRFIDEAKSLLRLDHPNIVKARDFFCVGEDCFIALEYVDGASLADLIDNHGAPSEHQALALFKGVLAALDHGHQAGVVHRDVKPSNILIDRASGRARLCDFGIAKQVAERGVTLAGVTLGTAEYMSPEQVQAPDKVLHRGDVYSAGIVLFEMLTGRVPFTAQSGESDFVIREAHVKMTPPDPASINPNIAPALSRIVLKALRKDPATRWQGCEAFRQAIERYEQGTALEPSMLPADTGGLTPTGGRRYSVYEHPTLGYFAVKQGFSWPAMLGNVFWMFGKGLYGQAVKWAAAYLFLFAVLAAVGNSGSVFTGLAWGSLPVLWLLPGFRGNAWRETELQRRGFELKAALPADTADAALARLTRGR